jgi:hypothetical protein
LEGRVFVFGGALSAPEKFMGICTVSGLVGGIAAPRFAALGEP